MSGGNRRVALVAGGTGPIGRAVAARLAGSGLAVALHHREPRRATAQDIVSGLPGGQHLAVAAELTRPEAVDAAVSEVERRLGPVDVLVNAAHPRPGGNAPVADTSPEVLAAHLSAVGAHAALCARVVPGMRAGNWGRVVYVSGALMARPAAGFGAYGAAKAAATALTRCLAWEEGRAGITANVVAPGRVVDPAEEQPLTPEQAELSRALARRMALPDFPTPAQVADAVAMLLGADAITGQTIWVTGGEPITG
ncbi:SDR family NAD(P)-dependent oxidoreductase [Streptomyces sp. NPDC058045]|uniref:SDR family NAD(P)-dependent oxidoreductase n=1 Tax=Streptomyces sp. NPDC058045 TaxID=3346311 RepID=UPI0036E08D49